MRIGDKDPASRRPMEEILALEEAHAEQMSDLLAGILSLRRPLERRTIPFPQVGGCFIAALQKLKQHRIG